MVDIDFAGRIFKKATFSPIRVSAKQAYPSIVIVLYQTHSCVDIPSESSRVKGNAKKRASNMGGKR